jgi:hypothetical protein
MINDILKISFLFVIALIICIVYPFAVIWAVNTLFQFNLNYTVWNWLAVVILHIFFQGNAIFTNTK